MSQLHTAVSPAAAVFSSRSLHEMSTCASFQVQMASIMEVLTKAAVAEITKLVDDGSAALRLEMCRSQRENEALKTKLLLMEGELRAVRGYGEGTADNSLNLSFQVQVCDEFREVQRPMVAGKGSVERLTAGSAEDGQNVSVGKKTQDAFGIKYEPVDGEQDWSESLLLSEDRLEEDPKSSQSQVEQKIIEESTCGTSWAAAAIGGEGPLKQEPEGQLLTPGHPLPESSEGLEVQCVWSEGNSSGTIPQKRRWQEGSSEHGDARLDDKFSPPHYRVSGRPCSEKDEGSATHLEQKQNGHHHMLPDDISTGMPFPQGSLGECDGSTLCEVSFHTSAELESRRRIDGQELICTCCGKTFPDALELKTHEEQHSREKPFACTVCDKSFFQWQVLQVHESTHMELKPYLCTVCGKRFRQQSYLKTHQRVHTRVKPFTCEQCGRCFSQIGKLKIHQAIHTRKKSFSCPGCSGSLSSFALLLQHVHSDHPGVPCFFCKPCQEIFDGASSLEHHRLAHHREKRFRCALCGSGFTTNSNLKSHQSLHSGEKPHRCRECGKSFTYLCNLKTHLRVHTGEKPFSCTVCDRGFSQNHVLLRHMLTHT